VNLDYTADAKKRFRDKAIIYGNAPFALISKCGQTRVFLFDSAEQRHITYESWHFCECGAKPCFGDGQHFRVTITGMPKSLTDAAGNC